MTARKYNERAASFAPISKISDTLYLKGDLRIRII